MQPSEKDYYTPSLDSTQHRLAALRSGDPDVRSNARIAAGLTPAYL